ncbi:hypothetical protein [Achromobacter aloeverae]
MRNLDFSSWQALLSTLVGLAIFTLIGVGIRLLIMQTVQQKRQRENRQINERLRTLIAAYKTLGGSFTGNLLVDPTHLRDLRQNTKSPDTAETTTDITESTSDRRRRTRDAVEAALSDIILLGTEEQVRLAAHAATELTQGRPIHTAELVASLRTFIREVLDLEPLPRELTIPAQGPARPSASSSKGKETGRGEGGKDGSTGGGGMGGGAGMGMGLGLGVGAAHKLPDDDGAPN